MIQAAQPPSIDYAMHESGPAMQRRVFYETISYPIKDCLVKYGNLDICYINLPGFVIVEWNKKHDGVDYTLDLQLDQLEIKEDARKDK